MGEGGNNWGEKGQLKAPDASGSQGASQIEKWKEMKQFNLMHALQEMEIWIKFGFSLNQMQMSTKQKLIDNGATLLQYVRMNILEVVQFIQHSDQSSWLTVF